MIREGFAVNEDRQLAFAIWGSANGKPVFLLHGTPGSRRGPRPRRFELDLTDICLITYDRPGYGASDRHPGRHVVDAADDVALIADELGLEQFAIAGRSGGAPHALACAARLPDRVTAAASLVGFAPPSARGLGFDWTAGMSESNRREFEAAMAENIAQLVHQLSENTRLLRRSADLLQKRLSPEMPIADRVVLADAGIRQLLAENFAYALPDDVEEFIASEHVLAGWLDDVLAFSRDWGFAPSEIDPPVLLWHGKQDVFVPVNHSLWLAEQIRDVTPVVEPRSAHLGALAVLPDVLKWLTRF